MKSRHAASIAPRFIAAAAVGAAVILGTSGCAMMSMQATTIPYSPADGVNVPDSGPINVRNALVVADEKGTDGNLIAALINTTDESQTLRIEYGDGETATIRVGAGETLTLGAEGEDPVLLEDIDSLPGTTTPMYFQSGDEEGVLQQVPVLDGSLDYLAPFVP
ncbi:MAG TPA: DNA modification methylase [Microbacterium sp.]|uniref:DNA modification methylase n=1 Tax=Microbacterium sp. TaxID=51671 RepID=UPI002CE86F2E|nr:DNA modification methylase [Microbacterium sp.]HWI30795.1 DNA modification methylase [Microbacterium sp.]